MLIIFENRYLKINKSQLDACPYWRSYQLNAPYRHEELCQINNQVDVVEQRGNREQPRALFPRLNYTPRQSAIGCDTDGPAYTTRNQNTLDTKPYHLKTIRRWAPESDLGHCSFCLKPADRTFPPSVVRSRQPHHIPEMAYEFTSFVQKHPKVTELAKSRNSPDQMYRIYSVYIPLK